MFRNSPLIEYVPIYYKMTQIISIAPLSSEAISYSNVDASYSNVDASYSNVDECVVNDPTYPNAEIIGLPINVDIVRHLTQSMQNGVARIHANANFSISLELDTNECTPQKIMTRSDMK